MHDLSPCEVCLAREEHVLAFHLGDDIGMPFDLLVLDALATDRLAHPDQVWGRALKADDCVPWTHVLLQLIELDPALHWCAYSPCDVLSVFAHPARMTLRGGLTIFRNEVNQPPNRQAVIVAIDIER